MTHYDRYAISMRYVTIDRVWYFRLRYDRSGYRRRAGFYWPVGCDVYMGPGLDFAAYGVATWITLAPERDRVTDRGDCPPVVGLVKRSNPKYQRVVQGFGSSGFGQVRSRLLRYSVYHLTSYFHGSGTCLYIYIRKLLWVKAWNVNEWNNWTNNGLVNMEISNRISTGH